MNKELKELLDNYNQACTDYFQWPTSPSVKQAFKQAERVIEKYCNDLYKEGYENGLGAGTDYMM